jgi:adenylate cyclase
VLPFDNLSRDYFLSYLSDGFTEELINAFARLRDLPVIARESSFAQRGRLDQEREMGSGLGVTHVLEGSVRRTERRLEIDARLIDGGSGDRVWSEHFDGPAQGMLPIRDKIVASVATTLNRPLSEAEREQFARGAAAKPEAYDLLQRAREMRASASRDMARQAIRTLEEAVALDPEFALGWSELAVTLDLAARAGCIDPPENQDRILDAAERAIALDPSLGEAHVVLGAVLLARGEPRGMYALEEGVAACPNAAWPAAMLGRHLPDQGRPAEGLQMIERAFRLNPVAPGWYFEARGWARFALRQHDEAVADFDEAARLAPDDLGPRLGLTVGHAAAGRLDAARRVAEEVLRIAPGLTADNACTQITDPVSRERQVALLRLAGLPGSESETASSPLTGEGPNTDALLTHHFETIDANMPPNLDPDALVDLFAEDCVKVQPLRESPGGPFRGRDAMRRFFATFDTHWASWKHVERRRVVQGNVAVWEGLVQGTHKKTGKFVSMPIVFFLEFNADGKVEEEYVYVDNGLVEEQIR